MECKDLKAVCWVLLFCVASSLARFLNDTQNENSSLQGVCFYNGTWYEEKEELPTRGLCLICHCFPGFTEPNAFTCAVIDCPWEDYHKRFPGCTPIYADRDCCPIGWECDYGTQNPGQQLSKDPDCDCEWRYLKHYEAKGCRPVYEEKPKNEKPECTCPWRFDCSQADDVNADEKVCVYKKHVYPVGSKIPTTNPCESCSCTTDYFTQAATISCITAECPSVYSQTPLPEGCHYVYKEKECCPTSVECPANEKENNYKVPICEYKGKMYYEGEQIYPDEDPCLICLCNQNWTGINSTSCRQHDCMLERDSRKLKQGCIPIYHEKTCCPIDYHCADDDFEFKVNRGANFKSEDDEDEMCHFEGRYYPVGHTLDIKHPTHCVTCTCKTPPDFTCIHSSCPPPPNGDYANCRAVYKPNACCPDYKCHEKKGPSCPDPICQGTNCWLETREDGCAVCRCKSRCVPCPEMCRPEKADNPCSGCICQINSTVLAHDPENPKKEEEITEEPAADSLQILIQECKKMECASSERCMLVEKKCDSEPCLPVPQCEKVSFGCGQKSCPEGCEEIGSYENSCPICYCKKETKESQYKLTCHVQSCEENCVLTGRDQDGCPLCKCPQGNLEERACAQSYCKGYNCTMTVNSLGCAECRCQLSCKPRECPAGCDMDLDVPPDSGLECGCTCKNSSTAVEYIQSNIVPDSCKPVSCEGLNCTVVEDKSGCPTCTCKAPCPEPKCQDGCEIEKNVKEPGRCPRCVCKLSRSARDNAAKECPPPTCLGYNCSVIAADDGCQKCICESPCEENPQCPSHCQLETNVPQGRCRGCICSFGEESDSEGGHSRRGESDSDNPENEDEPEKREDLEADFIPMPGKDIVPGVDKIYLVHGDHDQDQYGDLPGYHYEGGHAYPVVGEHLESVLYNSDDHVPGELESGHAEEASEDLYSEATEERHHMEEYDDEKYESEFPEEKTIDDEEDEKCAQKNCPEGQKCVIRRLQCIRTPCPTIPVCIDVEPRCPIPMCSIGCMVMKWDDEVCPSCFCGIIRGAEGRVCPRTRCIGRRCYNVIGDDGCPTCKCDSICIPPTCSDGCWIETDPPDGKCPTCTCPQRGTVEPPIIPGTSPAITTSGPNVEPGIDSGIVEEPSEDYEHSEDIPVNYFEEEGLEQRNPHTEGTTEATEEDPEEYIESSTLPQSQEVQKTETTTETQTLDFYNSLAEIEQQIRAKEQHTTVTVDLPAFDADIKQYDATTGIVTGDSDFEQTITFNHHSPTLTGTQISDNVVSTTKKPPKKPQSPYKLKTTTLIPTTETTTVSSTTELSEEDEDTTGKPCMYVPTTKAEEIKPAVLSTYRTLPPTPADKEITKASTVSQKVRKPTSTPMTRKPQRKQPARRKPSTPSSQNKISNSYQTRTQEIYKVRPTRPQEIHKVRPTRPQEIYKVRPTRPQEIYKGKPRPHAQSGSPHHENVESERNTAVRPIYIQTYWRRPVNKPPILEEESTVPKEKNNTKDDDNGMKPILQNLQQLMSNLNNVLTNQQRPLQLQQTTQTTVSLETEDEPVTTVSSFVTETTEVTSHEPVSSESEQESQAVETSSQSIYADKVHVDLPSVESVSSPENEKIESNNTDSQKLEEEKNDSAAKEPEVEMDPPSQITAVQNPPYQPYYINNPNIPGIIAPHHMLSNPQFAQLFQQSMGPQFPMFPQFSYQSAPGGIQGYGFLHQPQMANVPYQSHIPHPSPSIMHSQSTGVNHPTGQSSGQNAQSQSSYYPTIQHSFASNIPSSTDHYSQSATQLHNPHLLLTNIPIPPSLQQQLNSGKQTLGFLQYYLKPSGEAILQQNLNQAKPSSDENGPKSQSEIPTTQSPQEYTEPNAFTISTKQSNSSVDNEQSENALSSIESDNQDTPEKKSTQQITESQTQTGANEALSQVASSASDKLPQLNDTEEHPMPPYPETSSTTVSTSFNENKNSTSSVFYEGGSTESTNPGQPEAEVSPVLQQFNHHAPQTAETSHLHPQAVSSSVMNPAIQNQQALVSHQQEVNSGDAAKQEILLQSSSESQSENHHVSITDSRPIINQDSVLKQDSKDQIPLSIPSHTNEHFQQNSHHGIHATSHFRPFNVSQPSPQWQQNQQQLSPTDQRHAEQNQMHSANIPMQSVEEKLNVEHQNAVPTTLENQQAFISPSENFNVPFGVPPKLQNSQEQISSYQPQPPVQEMNIPQIPQIADHKLLSGQQVQVQIANLQSPSQYQQNYYQQQQSSQDKVSAEQEKIQPQVVVQNNQQYQPMPSSFINSQNAASIQEQYQNSFQNDKVSSQHGIQQHYISNHNVPVMQPVNKPQHIKPQNEVPIQFQQTLQQNYASSAHQTSLNKEQTQHLGSHIEKPLHQIHENVRPQVHTAYQTPQQQTPQQLQSQQDTLLLQQDYQSSHQQYLTQANKPLQEQINAQQSPQSTYFIQTSQQNQPAQTFITSQSTPESQQQQQTFVTGSNPQIGQLPDQKHGSESSAFIQPVLSTNAQHIQQQNFHSQYSGQQEQFYLHAQEKPTQTQYQADTLQKQQAVNIPTLHQQVHQHFDHRPAMSAQSQVHQQHDIPSAQFSNQMHQHHIVSQDKQSSHQIPAQFADANKHKEQYQVASVNPQAPSHLQFYQQSQSLSTDDSQKPFIHQPPQIFNTEIKPQTHQQAQQQFLLSENRPLMPQVQQHTSEQIKPFTQPQQIQNEQYIGIPHPTSGQQLNQNLGDIYIQHQTQQQHMLSQNRPVISEDKLLDKGSQTVVPQSQTPQDPSFQQHQSQYQMSSNLKPHGSTQYHTLNAQHPNQQQHYLAAEPSQDNISPQQQTDHFVNQQSTHVLQQNQQQYVTAERPQDHASPQQQMQQFINLQTPQIIQNQQHYLSSEQSQDKTLPQQQIQSIINQQQPQTLQNQQQYINPEQSKEHASSQHQVQHFINQNPTQIPQNQQQYLSPEQSQDHVPSHQQHLINQQLTQILQNQQQFLKPEQSQEDVSSQHHHFINQQLTEILQNQHQYMNHEQPLDPVSLQQQIQQLLNQQPTQILQNQQQYVNPEQSQDHSVPQHQTQQFLNQKPTKIPQGQQQYVVSEQSHSSISAPQQMHHLISQPPAQVQHSQQDYISSGQSLDGISSSQQIQHIISQQPTKVPQMQQQLAVGQSQSSISNAQQIPHFINKQTPTVSHIQQPAIEHSQPNIVSTQQVSHFINKQPTAVPQMHQQFIAEQAPHGISSGQQALNFINKQTTKIPQNQQQYATPEQTMQSISSQQVQQFVNPPLKAKPSLSVAVPQQQVPEQVHQISEIPKQQYINIPNSAQQAQTQEQAQEQFMHTQDQKQQSEQYFVDFDPESSFAQQYNQEFVSDEHDQGAVSDDSESSYHQQYHEEFSDNEDKHVQQYSDDKYSQLAAADSQAHVQQDMIKTQEQVHTLHSSEKKPVDHFSVDHKLNETAVESAIPLSQHSVPPFEPETPKPHRVKTRPGVTAHPHFHPVGYQPSPEPEPEPETDAHDLFPAPSRPLKRKPEVQEDFVDQEFVEEDMPQEVGEYEEEYYEFYETPSTTTTTTTTTTTKRPTLQFKRKPSRRPPIRFSPPTQPTTTTSKPNQQEFIESFDNHQPDSVKPIDQQEFLDEATTSKKYIYLRPTSTRRPTTKNPIKFASFPTVSPTAEAYGLKQQQQHTTKAPVNPFASYHCPTPHCNGYNCSLIRGSDGCQKCVCDSPCAPCPQHCVKTKTLSEGRCPICDCTNPSIQADATHHCPTIECGGTNCRKVKDNNGCPTCICDPKCAEPKCDPGCEILTNVPPGQCPGCVCRVTVVQAVVNRPKGCPSVQCTGPMCRTTPGPDGCLQCICDPCPPPKCDPGCELQTDVAQGQCPTCVCPSYNDDDGDLDDENYCPNLFCADYGCREVPGPAGCPICMCDPVCETPVCEPGCEVVTNKHMGKCPVCICSSPLDSDHYSSPNTSHENTKNAQHHHQHQQQVTFSGLIEPVVADTTVTVDVDMTEEYASTTEEPTTTTTEEPTTTEMATTEPPTCPAPVCSGLRCSYETGEDGCEVCKCRYKCPKPKCVGNCYPETNAPAHRCPGCVCPSRRKPTANALRY